MAITLKAARVNKQMNQSTAAKAIGVSVDTLLNWEHARTFPDVLQVKKIEEVYGVSYDEIIFLP